MNYLSTQDIKFLPGVGPKRALTLNQEAGIHCYEHLLYYFPYKYIDRTKVYKIIEVTANLPYIQVKGRFTSFETIGQGRSARLVGYFTDGTAVLELVWFKGIKHISKNFKPKTDYVVFGKPSSFGKKINIVHPDVEPAETKNSGINDSLLAFYNTSEKMKSSFLNSKMMHKLQMNLWQGLDGKVPETLPAWFVQKYKLLNLHDALFNIHFPQSVDLLKQAQLRLKFEELYYIQLNILRLKNRRNVQFKGHVFSVVGEAFNTFFKEQLPFELTNAQKKVIKEIRRDLGSGLQMNRLLQGDVGSGKTMVALMVALIAKDNGYQSAIMAPTEILATQHFKSITEMLGLMNIKVGLLTGSSKKAERTKLHAELLSGDIDILIGTHALIEDKVQFRNLGLVIIDEQHRFGVAQRAKLWKKNHQPPHVLVMTATPIPRTLAMTLYGDLDVSVIDELPPGRKPIQTFHFYENKRDNLNSFIGEQITAGRQIYMVYPLIQESESLDFKNLEDGYLKTKSTFQAPKYTISMVHGKMKPSEKEEEMQCFLRGETDIMVATTVIEVGVNVPNASVMVIESAERFGLSQLHQLRGRVGRGAEQSYCILMTSPKLSEDGRKRMETMVRSTDGFEISEVDLKLRGPGDIEGTQQSGLPFDLKIANLTKDAEILGHARRVAQEVLEADPLLQHPDNFIMHKQLDKLTKARINWSLIS